MFNIASYQEGYTDGFNDGYEKAKAEYEKKIEVITIHKFAKPEGVKDLDFPNSKSSEDKKNIKHCRRF